MLSNEFHRVYEIKLTANSCIALCSSRNAVSFLIRTHNETLSVTAMRINNPGRSPLRIKG
jgi:hypothetical protein